MSLFLLITLLYSNPNYCADSIPEQTIRVKALSEIVIQGTKHKILTRNDTSFFSADRFRDGSEKKLEEVLAKLPGISINPDNGKITYKGNTVEAVKIDGFDLLGSNYVMGTRNISADIIEEIQAIENDPANPLLKNMQTEGRTILNLKTKKHTGNINSDISAGAGRRGDGVTALDAQMNLLGLSGRMKFFTTTSFNNRGVNRGAAGLQQSTQPYDTDPFTPYYVKNLIDPLPIYLPIENYRYHLNNTSLFNTSLLFQPGRDQQSVRLNVYASADRIFSGYDQYFQYDKQTGVLGASDRNFICSMPWQLEADLEWKQYLSKKIWIQYRGNFQQLDQQLNPNQRLNDSIYLKSSIASASIFNCHELQQTFKPNPTIIFRSSLTLGYHSLRERFYNKLLSSFGMHSDKTLQEVIGSRQVARFRGILSVRRGKNFYELEGGIYVTREPLYTSLKPSKELNDLSTIPINDQLQTHTMSFSSISFNKKSGRWLIAPRLSVGYHKFSFIHKSGFSDSRAFLRPESSLSVTKKINEITRWVNSFSLTQQPLSSQMYFVQPVMISSRHTIMNAVQPDIQKTIVFQSALLYHNLFRQQLAQIDFQVIYNDKTIFREMDIDQRFIRTRISSLKAPVVSRRANARLESFIRQLQSTCIVGGNINYSNYYNRINQKLLRNNIARNISLLLEWKTSFKSPVNAGYKLEMNQTLITSDGIRIPGNYLLNQRVHIYWRHHPEIFVQFMADWYSSQRNTRSSILFIDFLFRYKPQHKKYSFICTGKNLLNHRYFSQWQQSDIETTILNTQIMPAYILLQFDYRW